MSVAGDRQDKDKEVSRPLMADCTRSHSATLGWSEMFKGSKYKSRETALASKEPQSCATRLAVRAVAPRADGADTTDDGALHLNHDRS